MPVSIPQSVFDKYYDVVDSTFTIFGVTCQLVHIEMVEEFVDDDANIPDEKDINAHRRRRDQHRREDREFKEVEKLEDITLKVYWDSRNWVKVAGDLVIPDGSIQTHFLVADFGRITRAKELIVHKDIKDLKEMRFKRFGEPFPIGLKLEKYFACFWERT